MAEGNGNGRPTSLLPWAQFAWTVGIAILGGAISGVTAFYSLRDNLRSEIMAQVQQVRAQEAQERHQDLQGYLPVSTYWQLREEVKGNLNDIARKLDRIEYRLK